MEFPVPQFIEVEEKILGPLNFRQTIYLIGAGALLFILWFFTELWLFIILTILIMGMACLFAFLKIGGRTFGQFLTSVITYAFTPRFFVWKKTERKPEERGKTELVKPVFGLSKEERSQAPRKKGLEEITKKIDLGIRPH